MPAYVYGAADDNLRARVEEAFVSDGDPAVLRAKALGHVRGIVASLPVEARMMTGDLPPGDVDWIVGMLAGMFSSKKLLAMSKAEIDLLVRGLLASGDGDSVLERVAHGPGLVSVGMLLAASGVIGDAVLTPLERVSLRWANVLSRMAYAIMGVSALSSQRVPGQISYSVQVALAKGLLRSSQSQRESEGKGLGHREV